MLVSEIVNIFVLKRARSLILFFLTQVLVEEIKLERVDLQIIQGHLASPVGVGVVDETVMRTSLGQDVALEVQIAQVLFVGAGR